MRGTTTAPPADASKSLRILGVLGRPHWSPWGSDAKSMGSVTVNPRVVVASNAMEAPISMIRSKSGQELYHSPEVAPFDAAGRTVPVEYPCDDRATSTIIAISSACERDQRVPQGESLDIRSGSICAAAAGRRRPIRRPGHASDVRRSYRRWTPRRLPPDWSTVGHRRPDVAFPFGEAASAAPRVGTTTSDNA